MSEHDPSVEFPLRYPLQVEPFTASIGGWSSNPEAADEADWPNTVTVSVVTRSTGHEPAEADGDDSDVYADRVDSRELVEVDTNYKPGRSGEHPVRLTRADAIALAVHVLSAVDDTFHYTRCGRLRGREAAEVLQALESVQYALSDLREHALQDLLQDTHLHIEGEGG
jgi:hypothetical protein